MALPDNLVWECRTFGDPLNGGAFVAGGTGTDWSQQDTPQYSVTNAVTNGTTTITSATANFGVDVVDNVLCISGGTGAITLNRYRIVSRTSATAIVVDRSTGLTTGTGATLRIGGAVLFIVSDLAPFMVASNKAYVKAGNYTHATTATFAQTVAPTNTAPMTRIIGYTTTRGDGGRASITLTTTNLQGITATGQGFSVENFDINCGSFSGTTGIYFPNYHCRAVNCKISNFGGNGIFYGVAATVAGFIGIRDCEITGGTSAATAGITSTVAGWESLSMIHGNYIHDNACTGIYLPVGGTATFNLITNNTGASSDGILAGHFTTILNNTIYGSGRDGIRQDLQYTTIPHLTRNNILAFNGGYGYNFSYGGGTAADAAWDGNAYWSNTSGTRNNMDNVTGINSVAPYTNVKDVVLSASPFISSTDFRLNATGSAGLLLRGTGTPGAMTGSASVGKIDFGVFQHLDYTPIAKNTALNNFELGMVLSDHYTPATGKTVTATRSLDGAAFAACANAVTEVAFGAYKINLAATDTNADCIMYRFAATGCEDTFITLLTFQLLQNSAITAFPFVMVLSSTHGTGATGKTVTATRSIDGAAFAACSNSVSEISSGVYKINLSASDMNGRSITLRFTATSCDDSFISLLT